MEPFFAVYLTRLESHHQSLKLALASLPQEALDWVPGEEMNSLAVLAAHIAGAERFLVCEVALGEPSGRMREQEFATQGQDAGALIAGLDRSFELVTAALERLTLFDLSAQRTHPRRSTQVTVGWALLHALEHTAEHVGQVQLTRQLWEQNQGLKER